MEVAQILENSTDFLLFGIEKETIIDLSEYVKERVEERNYLFKELLRQ